MNTKLRIAARGAAVVAALVCASSLAAQIYTPSYASPRSMGDFGVYVADGPGNFSLEGILRSGLGAYDFGFRGGVATGVGPGDDTYALVGVDMRNPFTITGAPLDFAFTAAFQGMIGDDSRAGGAVGITTGYTFVPGDFRFTPYIHPRFALLSDRGESGLDGRVLADLGLDFEFQPMTFRLAFGLSSPTPSWGLGVSWR
jgi:hypothetical protein